MGLDSFPEVKGKQFEGLEGAPEVPGKQFKRLDSAPEVQGKQFKGLDDVPEAQGSYSSTWTVFFAFSYDNQVVEMSFFL